MPAASRSEPGRTAHLVGIDVGRDDVGHDRLAGRVVGDADHRHGAYPGDVGDDVLDLDRVDVETGDDHQLLDPVDEHDVAAFVDEAHVSG